MLTSKLTDSHLGRRAVVYVRQSTLKQVAEHRESTQRQYGLRERAVALGWPESAIEVIDEDLGRSGSTAAGRTGFARLSEEVARGSVGAVFALEVSRFARSSADWHRLLDLCGIADVLIGDEQMVYSPKDPNDRLLLGIKGTMSEAELGWMRLRLRGARASKARRGELWTVPPIGYQWDKASARFRVDPDESVQSALRLLFDRFAICGSARGVMRYFAERGLKVPGIDRSSGELRWSAPRPSRILALLHNPTYAGAYVHGRREHRLALVDGDLVRTTRRVPATAWKVELRDRHPGYITWEQYVQNQNTLRDQRLLREPGPRGAAREGAALLQGIVLCGRCGHKMHVTYGRTGCPRYFCSSHVQQGLGTEICWSVSGVAIDAAVAELVLQVVSPADVELGLAVLTQATRQADAVDAQWHTRLEAARFEARLAERRYKAVDPDNRVVARTLEREWNDKLTDIETLESQRQDARRKQHVELDDVSRARILSLCHNLPLVWNAPSTSQAKRKQLLRLLVEQVCLVPRQDRGVQIRLQWRTGAVQELEIPRQVPGKRDTPQAAVDLIEQLVRDGTPAGTIAVRLGDAGLRTARGRVWTKPLVHAWCHARGVRWPEPIPTCRREPDRYDDGTYSKHGVAALLGVKATAVMHWQKSGWIPSARLAAGNRKAWCFEIDDAELARLAAIRDEHTTSKGLAAISNRS